jgi:hypothetical protein
MKQTAASFRIVSCRCHSRAQLKFWVLGTFLFGATPTLSARHDARQIFYGPRHFIHDRYFVHDCISGSPGWFPPFCVPNHRNHPLDPANPISSFLRCGVSLPSCYRSSLHCSDLSAFSFRVFSVCSPCIVTYSSGNSSGMEVHTGIVSGLLSMCSPAVKQASLKSDFSLSKPSLS